MTNKLYLIHARTVVVFAIWTLAYWRVSFLKKFNFCHREYHWCVLYEITSTYRTLYPISCEDIVSSLVRIVLEFLLCVWNRDHLKKIYYKIKCNFHCAKCLKAGFWQTYCTAVHSMRKAVHLANHRWIRSIVYYSNSSFSDWCEKTVYCSIILHYSVYNIS
jgi:hypothetical protein